MTTLAAALRPVVADSVAAPRVYVDANMPQALVAMMRRELGWDVLFVLEDPALRRDADVGHYARARELGRTVITLDRDFLDERRFPSATSPGVVVCWAADDAGLRRLLREANRTFLRPTGVAGPPLFGRKIELVPTPRDHDTHPARRRRSGSARSRRRGSHARSRS